MGKRERSTPQVLPRTPSSIICWPSPLKEGKKKKRQEGSTLFPAAYEKFGKKKRGPKYDGRVLF